MLSKIFQMQGYFSYCGGAMYVTYCAWGQTVPYLKQKHKIQYSGLQSRQNPSLQAGVRAPRTHRSSCFFLWHARHDSRGLSYCPGSYRASALTTSRATVYWHLAFIIWVCPPRTCSITAALFGIFCRHSSLSEMELLQVMLWTMYLTIHIGLTIPVSSSHLPHLLQRRHGGGTSLPTKDEAYETCFAYCFKQWTIHPKGKPAATPEDRWPRVCKQMCDERALLPSGQKIHKNSVKDLDGNGPWRHLSFEEVRHNFQATFSRQLPVFFSGPRGGPPLGRLRPY